MARPPACCGCRPVGGLGRYERGRHEHCRRQHRHARRRDHAAADPGGSQGRWISSLSEAQVAEERPAANAVSAVTPLARRLAVARNIQLAGVRGSGARGRIVVADLGLADIAKPRHDALSSRDSQHHGTVVPTPVSDMPLPTGVPVKTIKLSAMRKTIAHRLYHSNQAIPHFYLTSRCRLDALRRLPGLQ